MRSPFSPLVFLLLAGCSGRETAPPAQPAADIAIPLEPWVLPNPGGLNAHHPPEHLAAAFRALRRATVSGSRATAL